MPLFGRVHRYKEYEHHNEMRMWMMSGMKWTLPKNQGDPHRDTSVTRTRRGQQMNNETEGKVRNANEHEHECQNCDSKRYDWGETTLNVKNTERWRLKVPKRICAMALNAEMNDGSKHLKLRKIVTSNAWMGMKNGSECQTKEKKRWHWMKNWAMALNTKNGDTALNTKN